MAAQQDSQTDPVLWCSYEWEHLTQEARSSKVCERTALPPKSPERALYFSHSGDASYFERGKCPIRSATRFVKRIQNIPFAEGVIFLNFRSLFRDLEAVWVGGKITAVIKGKGGSHTLNTSLGETRCV